MTEDFLRLVASVLSLAGSLLLAWRVKGLLTAITTALLVHQQNIENLADDGRSTGNGLVIFTGATTMIENAQRRWLLYLGFALIIASGAIQTALMFGAWKR